MAKFLGKVVKNIFLLICAKIHEKMKYKVISLTSLIFSFLIFITSFTMLFDYHYNFYGEFTEYKRRIADETEKRLENPSLLESDKQFLNEIKLMDYEFNKISSFYGHFANKIGIVVIPSFVLFVLSIFSLVYAFSSKLNPSKRDSQP